jgi:secreted trypsin-like serine protease
MQVDVNKIDFKICARLNRTSPGFKCPIEYCMLCAGRLGKGGFDTCSGGSGGPLMIQQIRYDTLLKRNVTQNIIVGLTSWVEGCAQAKYPGLYTKVSQH